jgi:hypothetical protein
MVQWKKKEMDDKAGSTLYFQLGSQLMIVSGMANYFAVFYHIASNATQNKQRISGGGPIQYTHSARLHDRQMHLGSKLQRGH